MEETLPGRVRFGSFELDLKSGELLGAGRKVVLQDQPFKVLRILVESGGEVVSREVIQKSLWPNDTVVEFDHSINAVINKLRRILDDSAEEPKYIETLARRGYRLMAPVKRMDSSAGDTPPPSSQDQVSDSEEYGEKAGGDDGRLALLNLDSASWTGKTVSHYRVLNIIDGGGMGVVYRAKDLKLPRAVAIKFLPEELGNDPRALERFEREARAASVLEHPNICSIYEFGEQAGRPFIVMHLLQGQNLRERLAAGPDAAPAKPGTAPFTVDQFLDVAIQIAHGLEAAHEKGIIHRDIKPGNIFLTNKGVVKILDFGLAKLLQPEQEVRASEGESTSGPETARRKAPDAGHLTRLGVAIGTAAYMSPEQVRGEPLDARTDLFSFGVVLYEMATAQHPFAGETEAMLHTAIVKATPVPVRELNATLPPELEPIVNKALEKDREHRYQSAAQMRADLEAVKRGRDLTPAPSPGPPEGHPRKSWQLAAALLVVAALAVGVYWWRNRVRITPQDTIVLADFTNSTTDPVFTSALNTALRVEFEQTPFLNLLAPDKVRGVLKQRGHAENEKLTPELAREVCLHTSSKAFIAGSISDVGNRYRVELKALDCQTGKTFAAAQKETGSRDEVVKTLGGVGAQLRRELGEPRESLQQFNQPLEEATSSSPEALQAMTDGLEQKRLRGDAEALPYFQRAVELDPNFARAYASLGIAYRNLAEVTLSVENLRKAYDLRDRVTQLQRFYIDGAYAAIGTGDLQQALQTFTEWTKIYPKDPSAHSYLSAASISVGRYEEAAKEARESIRLMPTAAAYTDESFSYLSLDRLDDAKRVLDEAQTLKIGSSLLPLARYRLAFLKGDRLALEEQVNSATGRSRGGLLCLQSFTEAFNGRARKARAFLQQVVDLAMQDNAADSAADCAVANALQEAEIGNVERAQQQAAASIALSTGRDVQASAALAFTRAGDVGQAEKLAQQLNRDYPKDTMMQNYSLPTIRAAIELQKNNPAEAVHILKVAVPYEMGVASFANLYPAYVRGEAYLKAGQGQQAAAEFQKLLDHPGILENFVTGALAHLQLGRAHAMIGNNAAARKAYDDFFALWKDADRDIPILQQARAEYAKLR